MGARADACGLNPCCGLTWYNAPRKRKKRERVLSLVVIVFSPCAHREPLHFLYDFEQPPLKTMSRLLKIQPKFHQETTQPGRGAKNFAGDSGLVYTEYTCNASPMTADWTWKTRGSSHEHGRFRSLGPGCSTLFNMATRSALLHGFSITPESLETLPWRVGQLLWRRFRLRWAFILQSGPLILH